MKLLFIHDHPFTIENNIVYSGGGLPSAIWDNYLKYFNEIRVIGRKNNNTKNKRVISSHDHVSFNLLDNYNSVPLKDYPLYIKTLKNIFKEEISKVDLIILRCPSFYSFLAYNVAKRTDKLICIEQVGNAFEALWNSGSIKGKIMAPIYDLINRRIIKKVKYVTYVAVKLSLDYPTTGYYEVFSDVSIPTILQPEELLKYRFFNTCMNIGLIGAFSIKYKGQDVLLKAISTLNKEIQQNINLYFVGVGNFDWVIEIANQLNLSNNIKYIGVKEAGLEIFNFLSNISLYTQPSFQEGMPRAMLEAMSMGCPVLASCVGGIPDIIKSDFLHKPGDYKTLGAQILRFYNNRKLLEKTAIENLYIVQPFLKESLNRKRDLFYNTIMNELKNE